VPAVGDFHHSVAAQSIILGARWFRAAGGRRSIYGWPGVRPGRESGLGQHVISKGEHQPKNWPAEGDQERTRNRRATVSSMPFMTTWRTLR